MTIGPALPPHLAHLAQQQRSASPEGSAETGPSLPRSTTPVDEDAGDDFGPALPPHLAAKRKAQAVAVSGPSRPGPSISVGPSRPIYDDDSDDDVVGPMPTGDVGVEKSAVQEFMEREERRAKEREEAAKPQKLERQEWMLLPPSSGVLSAVDPLRKRPTTFSRSTEAKETDSTAWTETPADRAQRVADEVAGIKRKRLPDVGKGRDDEETGLRRERDLEIRREVERHNKEQRGKSLLDQHASKPKEEAEKSAIWDHDRDMGITGRLLSDQERQNKIREARGLNDRFGHSKRGAYDM
ncbi:hypothetical protein BD324DRAFT_618007 [Kockovaella imperatae]|uniref:DUF3752 domain-containing protein n=1 Tax=Kockovaella imperatae TaxID=4999 RepID=A0A1Y1ULN5_9TREE|nr:hypothetical protein BD324DRAFT_618007 [Kockovaella imperatae]ORX38963.1 hypothetical protein BD324DRAFT_618007 [Kockovaella imperatae]